MNFLSFFVAMLCMVFIRCFTIIQFDSNNLQQWKSVLCGECKPDSDACQKNLHWIKQNNYTGYFDPYQTIVNNNYRIKSIASGTYITKSKGTFKFPAKGVTSFATYQMFLPTFPNSAIRGVVAYFHPTVFGRYNTAASEKRKKQLSAWEAIGMLFCSQNYVVIMPDYLGYNTNGDTHPYVLYPNMSVSYMNFVLNDAAQQILKLVPVVGKLKVFSIGYSEGAAYSMSMAKCQTIRSCGGAYALNDTFYSYAAGVGLEGAYNLSITQKFLLSNVSKADGNPFSINEEGITIAGKSVLSAFTFNSYFTYSLKDNQKFSAYTNINFYNMVGWKVEGKQYNLQDVWGANVTEDQISIAVAGAAVDKNYPPYTSRYAMLGHNSVFSLYNSTMLTNREFNDTLEAASLGQFGKSTRFPLFLYTLKQDSIVTPLNTENFLQYRNYNVFNYTSPNNQFHTCDKGITVQVDHLKAQLLANIFALHFIKNK